MSSIISCCGMDKILWCFGFGPGGIVWRPWLRAWNDTKVRRMESGQDKLRFISLIPLSNCCCHSNLSGGIFVLKHVSDLRVKSKTQMLRGWQMIWKLCLYLCNGCCTHGRNCLMLQSSNDKLLCVNDSNNIFGFKFYHFGMLLMQ